MPIQIFHYIYVTPKCDASAKVPKFSFAAGKPLSRSYLRIKEK